MSWWEWTLAAITAWTILVTLGVVWNHRIRLLDAPRVCSGCQRHFVVIGCPVHDRDRKSYGTPSAAQTLEDTPPHKESRSSSNAS